MFAFRIQPEFTSASRMWALLTNLQSIASKNPAPHLAQGADRPVGRQDESKQLSWTLPAYPLRL